MVPFAFLVQKMTVVPNSLIFVSNQIPGALKLGIRGKRSFNLLPFNFQAVGGENSALVYLKGALELVCKKISCFAQKCLEGNIRTAPKYRCLYE